jgi:hypothetical protein
MQSGRSRGGREVTEREERGKVRERFSQKEAKSVRERAREQEGVEIVWVWAEEGDRWLKCLKSINSVL